MFSCPVPACCASFSSANRFHRHLTGTVRKNRCGAYINSISYECNRCSVFISTVPDVRDHLLVCFSPPLVDGNEVRNVDNNSVSVPAGVDVDSGGDLVDSDTGMKSDESVTSEEHLDDDCSEDSDFDSLSVPNNNLSSISTVAPDASLIQTINWQHIDDPEMRVLLELYKFCIKSRCTHASFRLLRSLPFLHSYTYVPSSLKDLRRKVQSFIEQKLILSKLYRIHLVTKSPSSLFHTPYSSIADAVRIWFSVPNIVDAVRRYNSLYLPANLVDDDAYARIIDDRNGIIRDGSYSYNSVADGLQYIMTIKACVPYFREEYVQAVSEGLEVLVCNFGLYQDGFVKHLNSLVTQTIFCLSLGRLHVIDGTEFELIIFISIECVVEALTGEASLTGLSSLIIMLADSKGVKELGENVYWEVLVEELLRYQSGKLFYPSIPILSS